MGTSLERNVWPSTENLVKMLVFWLSHWSSDFKTFMQWREDNIPSLYACSGSIPIEAKWQPGSAALINHIWLLHASPSMINSWPWQCCFVSLKALYSLDRFTLGRVHTIANWMWVSCIQFAWQESVSGSQWRRFTYLRGGCGAHSKRVLCMFGFISVPNSAKNSDLKRWTGAHWTPFCDLRPHIVWTQS